MKNAALSILLFCSISVFGFEGQITMVKESRYDTIYSTYYVSDNFVRIEESDSRNVLVGIYLLDLNAEEIVFVHPTKQLYTKLKKRSGTLRDEASFDVKKTDNFKIIKGVKCYQWRVKNRDKNTEVAYWVTQNNFVFFEKMVSLLNKHEMNWKFFGHIPDKGGFFPMVSEERNLVRDQKLRTAVLQINHKSLDNSIFRIPDGYKWFSM